MKWEHYIERNGYMNCWRCDFGPHRWIIYQCGMLHYRLWCHDVCSRDFYTLWGAKRAVIEEAVEQCLYKIKSIAEGREDE